MHKLITLLLFVLFTSNFSVAQVPEAFNYQAILRDNSGKILSDKEVSIRISILQEFSDGEMVYQETHNVTTNEFGLITLEIGKGAPSASEFNTIDWNSPKHFLKIELDANGGIDFVEMGTNEMLSVPFALFAKYATNTFSGNYDDLKNRPELEDILGELNTSDWDKDTSDDFDGNFESLTNVPANLDTDATDDFDGDYNSLANTPTTISAAQTTAIETNTLKTSNVKGDWDAASGEAQILNKPDLTVYIENANTTDWDKDASDDFDGNFEKLTNVPTNLDTDATDDFDGDYNSLANTPTIISAAQATAIETNTLKTSNVKGDWDAASGEAQILNKPDLTVYLETDNTTAWDKDASDDFDGSFEKLTNVPTNLDTDVTDDFDGDYNSLANTPTTISAAQTTAIETNTLKTSNVQANWSANSGLEQILNKPITISTTQADAIEANTLKTSNAKADWSATNGDAEILNKPTIISTTQADAIDANTLKTSNVQADWSANSGLEQILNKPTTISAAQTTAIETNTLKTSNVKGDWDAASGEAQILNKPDLTVYVETANTTNWDKDASDDFDGSFNNLTDVPTNLDTDATDDFDGDYNSLANTPTTISAAQATAIETNTSKTSNVKGDWDAASGEAQILNKPDLTVYVETANTTDWDKNAADDFDGKFESLTNVPVNLDTDATDDFDGDYNSLANTPTTISAAQTTAIETNTLKTSNVKGDWDAASGEAQILNKPDLTVYVETANTTAWDKNVSDDFDGDFEKLTNVPSNLDTDATDDFDGDYNNLANKPNTISATQATAIEANTLKTSNVKGDWDAASGEAQILNKPDLTVYVETANTTAWDKNAADDFDGKFESLTNVPVNLDTDATDDFDGDYNSLANTPTTISAAQTTAIETNTLKTSNVKGDWDAASGEAQILNKPDLTVYVETANTTNWDKDASDDFDGSFNNLTDVPVNLDTDATDDFDGEYSSLSNIPTPDILKDADEDTKIQVEKNDDEDIIRFDIAGTEKMVLTSKALEFKNNNRNIAIGEGAGKSLTGTEIHGNTFVGYNSGYTNASIPNVELGDDEGGMWNSFFGYESGWRNTQGNNNVSMGSKSFGSNTTGNNNVAIGGLWTLKLNTTGNNNIAIGVEAKYANTTGSNNIAIGYQAGYGSSASAQSASGNIFLGYKAGREETGSNKLYIENSNSDTPLIYGEFDNNLLRINGTLDINNAYQLPTTDGTDGQVLKTDGAGVTSWIDGFDGDYNSLTNKPDLTSGTDGQYLASDGVGGTAWSDLPASSLIQDSDGDTHIMTEWMDMDPDAIKFTLKNTTKWMMTGNRIENYNTGESVFIGQGAGANDDGVSNYNTAIGHNSLYTNQAGTNNTAIGYQSLHQNYGNSGSTAIGYNAMQYADRRSMNPRITYNTAIGAEALRGSTDAFANTGQYNTAVGSQALMVNTTGGLNAAGGYNALTANTTGSNNIAYGAETLHDNLTGSGNVAIGYQAAYSETGSNKLYIENSNSTSPLIYGEFDNDLVRINGTLDINNAYQLPTVDGTDGQVLKTDGAGVTSWTDDFDGNYNNLVNTPSTITTAQAAAIVANTAKSPNVQADWNATSGDAQILNKPTTISTAQADAIIANTSKVSHIKTDWNAVDGNEAEILNKPDLTVYVENANTTDWDKNAADDFDGDFNSLTNVPANLDTDDTDDFDGNYNNLVNTPTTITPAQTDAIVDNTDKVSNVQADWDATSGLAEILNKPDLSDVHSHAGAGTKSFIGGGELNTTAGEKAVVVGGHENEASAELAFVGGGLQNRAQGDYSTVSGGDGNTASGSYATIGGGEYNIANNSFATVSGGKSNNASGTYATVIGGQGNKAESYGETVVGIFNTDVTPTSTTSFNAADRLFVIGNGTSSTRSDALVMLKNGNTTLNGQLTINNGTDTDYTLPANRGTVGHVLTSAGDGSTSWDAVPSHSHAGTGGYSFIGGGRYNTASGIYSVVAGGRNNIAGDQWATIGGGDANNASFEFATISGGSNNQAHGAKSFIGGGLGNIIRGHYSSILGGNNNIAQSYGETVLGIFNDTTTTYNKTSSISTDRLFVIGNGTATNARSSALVMLKNGNTTLNGDLNVQGGQTVNVTTVNAATYDLLVTDYILSVTYTSTGIVSSLTLPTAQCLKGRIIIIKDAGGKAYTNRIVIDTEGTELIDVGNTLNITTNYQAVRLYSDGSNWFTM